MSFQDFQKKRNRLTPREFGLLMLAGIILILAFYGLGVGNYYLANFLPEGGEFYLLRIGGRSFLIDQIEPYSGSVPARVQEQVYGGPAVSGEDQYILDIPFHLLMILFPLALFPDPLMARAFWMALSEIALAGFIYIGFRLLDRRIPVLFVVLLFIAAFTSFYAYRSLLEGSLAFLLGLAYVGILMSLRSDNDELAGALVVLSAFQWESGGPFLLFIIFWVFWEKRWRVLAGGGMLAFILMAISFFIYPSWLWPFLRASWANIQLGFGFSLHEILSQFRPQYGSMLGWILTAILIFTIGFEWRAARGNPNRFIWVACLTLTITPLLGHNVEMDQLVLLTFPVMLIVLISRERWQKIGSVVALLLLLFYFGVPWLLFTQGAPQRIGLQDDEVLFLFWPVFAVLGLYWIRWWMIRPPRTWLDRATEQLR
jgi:hypothetical protein